MVGFEAYKVRRHLEHSVFDVIVAEKEPQIFHFRELDRVHNPKRLARLNYAALTLPTSKVALLKLLRKKRLYKHSLGRKTCVSRSHGFCREPGEMCIM